jgi:benzoyl-CoA reductase subunit C
MTAFEQIENYYQDRGRRAREWHEAGRKVIGYLCCFVPEEIITAFEMLPYRIQGRPGDPIDEADAYIEPMACPFARSCFNLALKGEYDFLDGFVAPHSCDTVERLFHIWRHNKPSPFNHLLNVPHMRGPSSDAFYRRELEYFIHSLEEWSGRKLDPDRLREAIRLTNRRRAALRELYELRKADPPLVSGTEVTRILVAGMGLPAAEHLELVREAMAEIQARPRAQAPKLPRLFIWGSEIDDAAFIQLLEESGASLVMDDLCTGTRFFWDDVPETDDPLDGLAKRYLQTRCPRSYEARTGTREEDLENRFGHIGRFVREWKVDGIIGTIVRYCDTCELEGPDLREYLIGRQLPVLMIEDDYSTSAIGQLRTRVQAFLEMLA